ncbi:hypothetical protein [Pseudomonas zhanjiangensis]|uniref:Uncharacterized protein n=1 Tax=Pseudomonas zhanjiangensis TaxID=3239015 RepID=A0ABV3YWJ6_9PSED
MKTLLGSTALGGLLVIVAATASGQPLGTPFADQGFSPSITVAEGGSKALQQHHRMFRDEIVQRSDDSQRFTRMLEEQPTAAGPRPGAEERESMDQPQYRTPLERDRAEYGWH